MMSRLTHDDEVDLRAVELRRELAGVDSQAGYCLSRYPAPPALSAQIILPD
jgi:hypothetical protein